MDTADSGAICLPESACRELCSLRDGCKSQYETANLGPSTSYKFLAKAGTTVERMLQDGTGLSSDNILRFMPVSFASGGSYKFASAIRHSCRPGSSIATRSPTTVSR